MPVEHEMVGGPLWRYRLFAYQPSVQLEVFFAVAFFCTVVLHTVQLFQTRTWCFLPFVVGGYFECIGFVSRALLVNDGVSGWHVGLDVGQTLLLLLAPTLFAGSLYMVHTRIVRLTGGEAHSAVPVRWLTKVFVAGDLLSFVLQAIGAGLDAGVRGRGDGRWVVVAGLVVQLGTFMLFVVHGLVFYVRMGRRPTMGSETANTSWRRHLRLVVVASGLILARDGFRLAEYLLGPGGVLRQREIFTILLDSVLMFLCMLLFNLFHPSTALAEQAEHPAEIPVLGERGVEKEPFVI